MWNPDQERGDLDSTKLVRVCSEVLYHLSGAQVSSGLKIISRVSQEVKEIRFLPGNLDKYNVALSVCLDTLMQ